MIGKTIYALSIISILASCVELQSSNEPCTVKRETANCRGGNLTDFPAGLNDKNFTTLDLGFNNFTNLQHANIPYLQYKKNIRTVLMYHNKISVLAYKFFALFPNATTLDLSNNRIKWIGYDLCGMDNLEELNLSNNPIEYISEDAFSCLHNLRLLQLENVTIRRLPKEAFVGTKLSYIDLNGTKIENLDKIYFPRTLKTPLQETLVTTFQPPLYSESCQNTSIYVSIIIACTIFAALIWLSLICTLLKIPHCARRLQTNNKKLQTKAVVTFRRVCDGDDTLI